MFGLNDTPMRKAVIFDWGGVLMRTVDYEPRHCWDRRLGLPEGSVEKVVHESEAWKQVEQGRISPHEYWMAIGRQLHLSPTQLYDLRGDFYSGDRLDEDLLSLITSLRARGVQIGLLSNNSLELLDMLADNKLNNLFDDLIISAQIGILKPDPRAYHAILEKLGASAGQALFIDDARVNIEGALAVGMAAIHFEPATGLSVIIDDWLDGSGLTSAKNFAP
jgi:epoxide hydrolase-like predicted phosphatase